VLREVRDAISLATYYVAALIALSMIVDLTDDMPELQKEAREAAENLLWVMQEN
jgi:hypothetical protein